MSRTFESKEVALQQGIFCARGKNDISVKDLKRIKDLDISQFSKKGIGAEVYELENSRGEKVMIATAPFRDGYDLWVIADGLCLRTS